MKSEFVLSVLFLGLIALTFLTFVLPVSASTAEAPLQLFPPGESSAAAFARSSQLLSAAIAFSGGALAAGYAVGRAGSAGLAGTAERPEMRTTAIIITALGEALGIYGIVIAILILGQTL